MPDEDRKMSQWIFCQTVNVCLRSHTEENVCKISLMAIVTHHVEGRDHTWGTQDDTHNGGNEAHVFLSKHSAPSIGLQDGPWAVFVCLFVRFAFSI